MRSALGEDSGWPAEARLAYDDKFLYVAIRCTKPARVEYAAGSRPRPRDAELDGQDRVSLLLDIDRDYATYYRFEVDHRGYCREDCWGDKTWNPQWYVASDNSDRHWTAELAIPLGELTPRAVQPGYTWAMGIQRVVPGVGFQSFTQPAGTNVQPSGFGYLMFR